MVHTICLRVFRVRNPAVFQIYLNLPHFRLCTNFSKILQPDFHGQPGHRPDGSDSDGDAGGQEVGRWRQAQRMRSVRYGLGE